MRKKVLFELSAYEDLKIWQRIDYNIYRKVINILKYIAKLSIDDLEGLQLLQRELNGYYSIEIKQEHRLVCKITEAEIIVIACKYYYN